MSDIPVQLIIAAFDDEESVAEALTMLQAANREKSSGLQGVVMMHKEADGHKIHYKEVGLTPGKGALAGVVLGATVGILTGGAGLVLGAAGATLGGLMGRKRQESRLSATSINQVAATLKPGASAIMAVVEPEGVAALEKKLEDLGADVLIADISADIVQQLAQHREAAYSTLVNELDPSGDIEP